MLLERRCLVLLFSKIPINTVCSREQFFSKKDHLERSAGIASPLGMVL